MHNPLAPRRAIVPICGNITIITFRCDRVGVPVDTDTPVLRAVSTKCSLFAASLRFQFAAMADSPFQVCHKSRAIIALSGLSMILVADQ